MNEEMWVISQGLEEMCLSLEHQNPSKTSEKMGFFGHPTGWGFVLKFNM